MLGTRLPSQPYSDDTECGTAITCESCKACCCRLEVLLMAEDDIRPDLTEVDPWGGQVMARLDDGWCAALERATMLCRIYGRRPTICRDYQVGGSNCVGDRSNLAVVVMRQTA